MTDAEYRDALQLLDSATTLLERLHTTPPCELTRELRRLSVEFDLLKLRIGQPNTNLQRN